MSLLRHFANAPLHKNKAVGQGTRVELPPALGPEVAFIGRSNVGKSSLINALTSRKKLAVTSKTPGATRGIHFFTFGEGEAAISLVDLPGYGYAKLPKELAAKLSARVNFYLTNRPELRAVYVLVDARRGLKNSDIELLEYLGQEGVPAPLLLTKSDKIKPGALAKLQEELTQAGYTAIATAAPVKLGLGELAQDIASRISN